MSVGLSQNQEVVVHAQQVLSKHAKSFRLASLFLPRKSANDAAVVYSFCRLVDDAVDEAPNKDIAHKEAEALREELAGKRPAREEVGAFLDVAERCSIPLYVAYDLMDGVCSDLGEVALRSDHELARYCYRVAGTVGLMMCGVLGVRHEEAFPFAIDLGLGMQITNICRDVLEDARRGRVYVPESRLIEHGASSRSVIEETIDTKALCDVVKELLGLAETCYARAYFGMRFIPTQTRLAILIALRVYRSIGLRLHKKHACNPFHGRTIVPNVAKSIEVMRGVGDFLSPQTWMKISREPPASPFYTDWKALRE